MADLKSGSAGGKSTKSGEKVIDPDMSDVVMVIINVETRDGKQFSMVLEPEREGQHMSVTTETNLYPARGAEERVFTITRR